MNSRVIIHGVGVDELSGATLVTGFRTLGEVGYLATRHMVSFTRPQKIGFILTRHQRDIMFLDEYGIATPYDIFFDTERKIVYILNHILPIQREWTDYTEALAEWSSANGISNVILFGGLDRRYRTSTETVRWLKNSYSKVELPYPMMEKQQLVIGPLALFVVFAEMYKLPATVILPYADRERPDPAAAAVAIQVVNDIVKTSIDVKDLLEDARRIEEEITRQIKQIEDELNKGGTGRHYM